MKKPKIRIPLPKQVSKIQDTDKKVYNRNNNKQVIEDEMEQDEYKILLEIDDNGIAMESVAVYSLQTNSIVKWFSNIDDAMEWVDWSNSDG